jgi:hypothetical protein
VDATLVADRQSEGPVEGPLNGTVTIDFPLLVGTPTGQGGGLREGNNSMTVRVPPGTSKLEVGASWSCSVGYPCEMRLWVEQPSGEVSNLASVGQLAIVVEDPVEGAWDFVIFPDGVGYDVVGAFQYSITLKPH